MGKKETLLDTNAAGYITPELDENNVPIPQSSFPKLRLTADDRSSIAYPSAGQYIPEGKYLYGQSRSIYDEDDVRAVINTQVLDVLLQQADAIVEVLQHGGKRRNVVIPAFLPGEDLIISGRFEENCQVNCVVRQLQEEGSVSLDLFLHESRGPPRQIKYQLGISCWIERRLDL